MSDDAKLKSSNGSIEYDRYLDALLRELIDYLATEGIGLISFCEECDAPNELFFSLLEIYAFLVEKWGE